MIGIDTNVLVRYLAQDDLHQSAQATQFIEELSSQNQGFISLVVLVELHWLLRRTYGMDRAQVAMVFRQLLAAEELTIQESEAVHRALSLVKGNVDFPDALVAELGLRAGCLHTLTFDKAAAKLPGMQLLNL